MNLDDVHPGDMVDDDPTLTAFARDLTEAAAATPLPAVGAALASVLEGRTAAPAAPRTEVPAVKAPRRPARLRWAIGGAVFGIGIGSLGVAGALPDPVQHQVARVGDVVSINLPDPADATTTTTTVAPTTTVVRPTTVAPRSGTTRVDDTQGHRDGGGKADGTTDVPTTAVGDGGGGGSNDPSTSDPSQRTRDGHVDDTGDTPVTTELGSAG